MNSTKILVALATCGCAIIAVSIGIRQWQTKNSPECSLPTPTTNTLPKSETVLEPLARTRPHPSEQARVPVPEPIEPSIDKEALFAQKYAGLSWDALKEQRKTLGDELNELITPEGQLLVAVGAYEVVGKGNTLDLNQMDPDKVQCVMLPGAGSDAEIKRVTFPREQYPKFYEVNDEMRWIDVAMNKMRSK